MVVFCLWLEVKSRDRPKIGKWFRLINVKYVGANRHKNNNCQGFYLAESLFPTSCKYIYLSRYIVLSDICILSLSMYICFNVWWWLLVYGSQLVMTNIVLKILICLLMLQEGCNYIIRSHVLSIIIKKQNLLMNKETKWCDQNEWAI